MEFAERGPQALAEQSFANYGVDQFDSDFEQGVAWALRSWVEGSDSSRRFEISSRSWNNSSRSPGTISCRG